MARGRWDGPSTWVCFSQAEPTVLTKDSRCPVDSHAIEADFLLV